MIDLHIHTHYSDGKYSPADQLQLAASLGLTAIAFTDHENANGWRAGAALARQLGIELVPAVELTTFWPALPKAAGASEDVDLLGYGMDIESPAFRALESQAVADFTARIGELCANLTRAGYPLELEDILAVNPRFPSLSSTFAAIVNRGHAATTREAGSLMDLGWQQVRPSALEIEQAIRGIHAAGGLAVLAHPAIVHSPEGLLSAAALGQLVESGLDGIEIYHHRNDPPARAHFSALARRFNLLQTGGSDDHGWAERRLGNQQVGPEILEALRARLPGRG